MRISIFGLGYVGCTTGACFAQAGHRVIGVDVNEAKVREINEGRTPILEKGLDEIVNDTVSRGLFSATTDVDAAVKSTDLSLICVGTPSLPTGALDLEYVVRACSDIGKAIHAKSEYHCIVIRSTVLPGAIRARVLPAIEDASGKQAGSGFGVVVNPEFLREGNGIYDFHNSPFTIIGELDSRSGDLVAQLYDGTSAPLVRTNIDTAEMVKYTCNTFHALKITFANEVGNLCRAMNLDPYEVMEIFCLDQKLNLSSAYLKPGFAFGGSCLPKDLRALLYSARHNDLRLPVLENILPSNRLQVERTVDRIMQRNCQRVGIIGLSFKPNTDDLRESPMVDLAETLSGKGLEVRIFDQDVNLARLIGGNKAFIQKTIPHISALMCESLEEVVAHSDAVVLAHDRPATQEQLMALMRPRQLFVSFAKPFPASV